MVVVVVVVVVMIAAVVAVVIVVVVVVAAVAVAVAMQIQSSYPNFYNLAYVRQGQTRAEIPHGDTLLWIAYP